MVCIKREVRFNAPVDEVFAYIADFRSLAEYNPSIRQVEYLTFGPPDQGSRFDLTLSTLGGRLHALLTITDFIKNELIATRLDAFIPAEEKRVFRPEGTDTVFLFTIEFNSGWPLVGPLVARLLARWFAAPQADTELRLLEERFNR